MHHDQVAASETQSSDHKKSIMFIGDRGCGVGSPIKGHQQFGSTWKQKLHGRYTPALVINDQRQGQNRERVFCLSGCSMPPVHIPSFAEIKSLRRATQWCQTRQIQPIDDGNTF
ncbi:hypothetical protein HMPREF1544_00198 [Mucor circinelloides 1006PhL]|uniref:Uncharacterized protein n=1 Tax=Mucor circinelloides f. circinelloides (strain 1006PhL) TaxID=1220926 RepID=S2JT19_MUCC1|nr:hypothetical protein HMPREF1544_00198 [Mucor circinelloides 1006PhL]